MCKRLMKRATDTEMPHPSPQGGGKLASLLTTGCRIARMRQAVQGTQSGGK
jgi:hypothetical protein